MKIYACLSGIWYCLNDDPKCVMGELRQSPDLWYEEGAPISTTKTDNIKSYYELNYIYIHYKGIDYRINPIFIQIIKD